MAFASKTSPSRHLMASGFVEMSIGRSMVGRFLRSLTRMDTGQMGDAHAKKMSPVMLPENASPQAKPISFSLASRSLDRACWSSPTIWLATTIPCRQGTEWPARLRIGCGVSACSVSRRGIASVCWIISRAARMSTESVLVSQGHRAEAHRPSF